MATEVIGTAFRISLASGRVRQGLELAGATLGLTLPGEAAPRRLRLDATQPDLRDPAGEVLPHRVSLLDAAGAAAEPDPERVRRMFPLRGQWDAEGQSASEAGFTLTCRAWIFTVGFLRYKIRIMPPPIEKGTSPVADMSRR